MRIFIYKMRKLFFAALIVLVSTVSLYGQGGGHKFEAGVGYAPLFLQIAEDAQSVPYKCNAYLEWRYNFAPNSVGKVLDAGAKLDYKTFPTSVYDMGSVSYYGTQHGVTLLALADLNLNPGGIINPYFGLGLGPGLLMNHWKQSKIDYPIKNPDYPLMDTPSVESEFIVVASPRIGLELFNHLRVSASVDLSLSDTRWPVCFNVGWVF